MNQEENESRTVGVSGRDKIHSRSYLCSVRDQKGRMTSGYSQFDEHQEIWTKEKTEVPVSEEKRKLGLAGMSDGHQDYNQDQKWQIWNLHV